MTKTVSLILISILFIFSSCTDSDCCNNKTLSNSSYFDNTGRDDILSGGARMIPITTPVGDFNVWTKRVGNNPSIKVLLLHGGPGADHVYFECFDSFFPGAGIEYYYYDQLGSTNSDMPTDTSLWNIDRFVEEVEQVRKALNLDSSNFYLYGQSWGGTLALEYALKYQNNLKAMIISNMMVSIPDYNKYANEVLGPQLDPAVLAEIKEIESKGDFANPRYLELIERHYYPKHILRMPPQDWPEPVIRSFSNLNEQIYISMQGPSEFGSVGTTKLQYWDRKADLPKIKVPTLSIGGEFDTMDPLQMKWIASEVQNGSYLYCPNGSHMAMYDDQEIYFTGLIDFIKKVDNGEFMVK